MNSQNINNIIVITYITYIQGGYDMKIYAQTNTSNILDVIERYNKLYEGAIQFNDKYYMYGDPELMICEEVCIGTLDNLAKAYEEFSQDADLYDDDIFAQVVCDATDRAADIVLDEATAFRDACNALKKQYNL